MSPLGLLPPQLTMEELRLRHVVVGDCTTPPPLELQRLRLHLHLHEAELSAHGQRLPLVAVVMRLAQKIFAPSSSPHHHHHLTNNTLGGEEQHRQQDQHHELLQR